MMGTFMAAGIIPAYDAFAEEYNVTVQAASYLTSFQVSSTLTDLMKSLLLTQCLTHYIVDPSSRSFPLDLESIN